ncbi:hypothetical protein HY486_03785 [Candidatus Woesearchaeota archaeon]|nr:hypothetical protein [Candidatus Woesearchaeota archaeon]
MGEIYNIKITLAEAWMYSPKNTCVRLHYPKSPEVLTQRLPPNLEFGIRTLEGLMEGRVMRIGTRAQPIRPVSSGVFPLFKEETKGTIFCHRRGISAPTHKMYHSACLGFTNSEDGVYSSEGIMRTALREWSEEQLLVTKESAGKKPWLLVTTNTKQYVEQTVARLEMDIAGYREEHADFLQGVDYLKVNTNGKTCLFCTSGFIEMLWESLTGINLLQILHFPNVSSEEIVPLDTEFRLKNNTPEHLNLEVYQIPFSEVSGKRFGTPLKNFEVRQVRFEKGVPVFYTPEYSQPYYSVEGLFVKHPHVWAPEDAICRILCALNVPIGIKEKTTTNWLEIEHWKEKTILEQGHAGLLAEDVLIK